MIYFWKNININNAFDILSIAILINNYVFYECSSLIYLNFDTLHLRKDGLPDRRFKESKAIGELHFTKNGQLDRRFTSTKLFERTLSMNNLPQPNISNANARIISSGPQTTIANSRILVLGPHPYSAKNIEDRKSVV